MRRPPPTTHEAIQMCCEVGGLRGCLSTRVAAARELPPTRSQLLGDEAMLASLPFSVPVDLERHSEAPRSTCRLPWPRQHGDQAPPNDLAVVDITNPIAIGPCPIATNPQGTSPVGPLWPGGCPEWPCGR